jgi:lambda repressor-like predicted transcriptional regulator
MEILKQLADNGVKVKDLAKQYKVNRSLVYQSINGEGSRCIRVAIAKIIGIKPSELWADNPLFKKTLDDALFSHTQNSITDRYIVYNRTIDF